MRRGEQQQVGRDFLRFERPPTELQNAANLRRIREVGQRSEVQLPLGLPHALPAHEAPAPRPALPPHHRVADAGREIVELQPRLARLIHELALPPAREAGKQRRGCVRATAPTGRGIRRRAREQHRGFPAPVRARDHRHRIVERHPQVANPAKALQPDLVEEVVLHLLPRPQRVPGLSQRRVKDRHAAMSPWRMVCLIRYAESPAAGSARVDRQTQLVPEQLVHRLSARDAPAPRREWPARLRRGGPSSCRAATRCRPEPRSA